MIIGIFLRHYKIYKGANYIPFGINQIENLNLFIGQNGAGKSSILEALDTYFNQREFIFHTSEKKTEAFVAPLFYIPKEDLQKKFSKNSQKAIPTISLMNHFLNSKKI
jgi:AAA15 family ATPase/GTPase